MAHPAVRCRCPVATLALSALAACAAAPGRAPNDGGVPPDRSRRFVFAVPALAVLLAATAGTAARAQAPGAPLPTAERVLGAYHAAAGGAKRPAAIRDATYEWRLESGGRRVGTAVSRRMAPGALYEEIVGRGANVSNPAGSWRRRADGTVVVDTSAASAPNRLQAALEASYLVGLDRQGVATRVVGPDSADGERAWRVEFSRGGARRTYLLGARTGLPLRILLDEARGTYVRYADWRAVKGVLEPHRVEIGAKTGTPLVFALTGVRYNTGLTAATFAPPTTSARPVGAAP